MFNTKGYIEIGLFQVVRIEQIPRWTKKVAMGIHQAINLILSLAFQLEH